MIATAPSEATPRSTSAAALSETASKSTSTAAPPEAAPGSTSTASGHLETGSPAPAVPGHQLDIRIIIGVVVGALGLIISACIIVVWVRLRKRRQVAKKEEEGANRLSPFQRNSDVEAGSRDKAKPGQGPDHSSKTSASFAASGMHRDSDVRGPTSKGPLLPTGMSMGSNNPQRGDFENRLGEVMQKLEAIEATIRPGRQHGIQDGGPVIEITRASETTEGEDRPPEYVSNMGTLSTEKAVALAVDTNLLVRN